MTIEVYANNSLCRLILAYLLLLGMPFGKLPSCTLDGCQSENLCVQLRTSLKGVTILMVQVRTRSLAGQTITVSLFNPFIFKDLGVWIGVGDYCSGGPHYRV